MIHTYIAQLTSELELQQNKEKAPGMEAYMKGLFCFYGVSSVPRKSIYKIWKSNLESPLSDEFKWQLIRELWEKEQREYQYIAVDWMNSWPVSAYREGDIEELKFLISNKSWWDTVDLIASNYLGKYALKFPKMMDQVIMEWQDEKSIWLHRSCIIYQLKYKNATNLERLSYLIGVYKSNNAFFIQKSIGWSLREVSKWNPEWVKATIENKQLAGLAKREAMKYIAKK